MKKVFNKNKNEDKKGDSMHQRNNNSYNHNQNLSDADMLSTAMQDTSISRDTLGINALSTPNGMRLSSEGFNFLQSLQGDEY